MDKKKLIILILASCTVFIVLAVIVFFSVGMPGGDTQEGAEDNPFGNTDVERENILPNTEETDVAENQDDADVPDLEMTLKDGSVLRRISNEPVAGAMPFMHAGQNTGTEPLVRYLLRDSGDMFETPLARTTPPTLLYVDPKVRGVVRALWSSTASSTIALSLSTDNEVVYTYLGSFMPTKKSGSSTTPSPDEVTFGGRSGPTDPLSLTFSPDGSMFAFLAIEEKGSVLYTERVDSGTRRQVWSSPLRGLTLRWESPQRITVYTNPDDMLTGSVWSVDPASGAAQLLMSNTYGLAVLPHPSDTRLLYSQRTEVGNYSLRVRHLDGKEDTYLTVPTLAEKCAWGKVYNTYVYCGIPKNMNREGFISGWYRGEFSSDDVLWRFDTTTGAGKRLLDPMEEDSRITIDMVDLALDPTDTYLVFKDRSSGHLWSLELPDDIRTTEKATTTPGF